jgi:hypothetical protein
MKNIIILLVLFLSLSCFGQPLTNNEYDQLSDFFSSDVANSNITDSYSSYTAAKSSQNVSYIHSLVLSLESRSNTSTTSLDKILVIVSLQMYNELEEQIKRYAYDINFVHGCQVIMEVVNGDKHTDIKNLINSYQTNLDGVVLIGDISVAWYEISNDHGKYGYASWPCDLYYMDLNGVWTDADNNDVYELHTGNVQPEIFVGRISTANMGILQSEKTGLERYLNKNHKFWKGQLTINRKHGLSYTDNDWVPFQYFKTDINLLYGNSNYDVVYYGDPYFGKQDFLNNRLNNDKYEFIQLSCHSNYSYLAMSNEGISSYEIFNNEAKSIGYNLYCCSACRWTSGSNNGFLAGAFVYNNDTSNLVVVGSTKTGAMLQFAKFYTPLGQGKTIGESLKQWWNNACGTTHSNYIVSWHYGMSIIGDPMINFKHCISNSQNVENISLNTFDVSNTATHRYIVAKDSISVTNYVIPSGKHVVFNAKKTHFGLGFECQLGGTFEVINDGYKSNCP